MYLLDDNSGASLGWVLKAKLAGTAGRLSCLFPSWEREWTIGRQLTTELGVQSFTVLPITRPPACSSSMP